MKACVFDIECTDFDAVGAGILICAVLIPLETREPIIYRLDDKKFFPDLTGRYGFLQREETDELSRLFAKLGEYDLLIGHYIKKFDLKYLMTRAVRRDIEWALRPFVYDTFEAFRRVGIQTRPNGYGKPMAGLGAAADALGITGDQKTVVYSGEWWMGIWGNDEQRKKALDAVVEHCISDVRMNLATYEEVLKMDNRAVIKRQL